MRRGDWTPIYMMLVVIIAAIIIIALIKPMFSGAAQSAGQNLGAARGLAGGMLFR